MTLATRAVSKGTPVAMARSTQDRDPFRVDDNVSVSNPCNPSINAGLGQDKHSKNQTMWYFTPDTT